MFNTPITKKDGIFIKLEYKNLAGSVKDRPAYFILKNAYEKGYKEVIEVTSGNTGIALAFYSKLFDLKVTIFMPKSFSIERQKLLKLYGANLILVDGDMKDALKEAQEYLKNNKKIYYSDQFNNELNYISHIKTTSQEIIRDILVPDIIVAGIGSGGTLMGLAKFFRSKGAKIIAVESKNSPIIYNKIYNQNYEIKTHFIQGIGAGFIPSIVDIDLIDDVILVDDDEVIEFAKDMPKKLMLTGGLSSAANFLACKQINDKKNKIFTIFPDSIERYLSLF